MLQTNHMKNLASVLTATREELVKGVVKNVDNYDEAESVLKDISLINQAMELLGIHKTSTATKKADKSIKVTESDKSSKKTSAKTASATEETSENTTKKPRGRRKKITFSLSDDMKAKRPKAVVFDGNKIEVSSFRDMTRAICEAAFARNPDQFRALEENRDVNGSNHLYFSSVPTDQMAEPVEIQANGQSTFVDVAKLAMNNMLFLRKALKALDIPEESIQIEIDPDYERKPRSSKGTEE